MGQSCIGILEVYSETERNKCFVLLFLDAQQRFKMIHFYHTPRILFSILNSHHTTINMLKALSSEKLADKTNSLSNW